MFKPYRNTKNDMTFERAERAQWKSQKDVQSFFLNAATLMQKRGEDDVAFYFEQIADHLKDGGKLESDNISRVLGL
jgi:trans-aconitate methyltransferase